jgi:mono/diheme cytochrome c family protein
MRSAWVALAVAVPISAWAQTAHPPDESSEALGRRLFVQSCGVCHASVQRASALYGPALSKDSLGGQTDVMREVISNGTPRMPGFKHHFDRGEIDAIVAYLKTVPEPETAQQQQPR